MKSWQIYDEARKVLRNELYEIYGNRNARMIDYWAQDPRCSAERKRNPIDRLELLFSKLIEVGKREIAVAGLRILAGQVGCVLKDCGEVVPDRETLLGEIVDDMPCLTAYQKALEGDDLEEVDRAEAALQRELAENRVKFIEVNANKRIHS